MVLSVKEAVEVLKKSGVVVMPTETVYGLAACANDEVAVEKIYAVKQRPRDNPLICHFRSLDQIKQWGITVSPLAQFLFEEFAPGPLSVLLPLALPSPLTAATGGRPLVLCRIPNHRVALELLRAIDVPLAAPSANTSGRMSGTELGMIEHDLGNRVDGYLDGGSSVIGIESTIVDPTDPLDVLILRPGVIGRAELKAVLDKAYHAGLIPAQAQVRSVQSTKQPTPGSAYAHYAPRTPLTEIASWDDRKITDEDAVAFLAPEEDLLAYGVQAGSQPVQKNGRWYIALGSKKDLSTIARRLYYSLYQLDLLEVRRGYILLADWGEGSIATALKNRLDKILAY